LIRLAIGGALLGVALCVYVYVQAFTANTRFAQDEVYVNVPTGSSFEQVQALLTPLVDNIDHIVFVAKRRGYDDHPIPGHFLLKKGMSSFAIVSALRHNQPVRLAFNNIERLEDFAQRLSSQLEPDTTALMQVFRDSVFLKENGFTADNVFGMFLPNTHEVYWNTTALKFRGKMLDAYKAYWTPARVAAAKAQGLSPIEAITLASIVHKETVKKAERPIVAGVYLNRLHIGMKLQADPTVVYARKKVSGDFTQVIKRVLLRDLFAPSPYNTYVHEGLPPGPIAMPDLDAIEAVLHPAQHNYLYFCASVSRMGYHEFAATPQQHEVNRQKYVAWLNQSGYMR